MKIERLSTMPCTSRIGVPAASTSEMTQPALDRRQVLDAVAELAVAAVAADQTPGVERQVGGHPGRLDRGAHAARSGVAERLAAPPTMPRRAARGPDAAPGPRRATRRGARRRPDRLAAAVRQVGEGRDALRHDLAERSGERVACLTVT